jgi:predicted nucleotidyltransferase/HEPN domain-containing protein
MKNSLTHLPKTKQAELQKLSATIRKNCDDVEKIILYGSYARGDYKEMKDLKPDRKSGHVSDYDILVVTARKAVALDASLWHRISDKCVKLNLSAYPRIITHDIDALNIKLAKGQYFFTDIKKEGVVLYDSGKFELSSEGKLSAKERQRIAQDYYDEWYMRAEEFFAGHSFYVGRNSLPIAAFSLHQSAEAAYKCVLLVFSNYVSGDHFLEFLGAEAEKYSALMKNIFARISEEDEERFRLLEYAYIGGRYDPNYRISKEDLRILAQDVQKLLELTKKICEEKIRSFVVEERW